MILKINIKTMRCIAVLLFYIWSAGLLISPVYASDTMLMFVGEDLEVLTIASRKEEAAWSAPAIANVLTQNELELSGAQTLSQALDDLPGFHVEETLRGSIPYLRGIPNSALVLFDTVPIGSGAERENNRIDFETSLVPVKRIEVTRGAGSVLWGPDAFAGVVNAVPFTGKDFSGFRTGLSTSSGDSGNHAWLMHAKDSGPVASFISVSARHTAEDDTPTDVVSFWNDNSSITPVSRRFGTGRPDDSHYLEVYGNLSFSDWLVLSARLSDSQKAFSVTDWNQEHTWEEQKAYESKLFKLEATREIDMDAGLRFTGYYSDIGLDETIVDRTFRQKEYSAYGELIYERSLFAADALLTVGASYKKDHFKDVLVWETFYPEFFKPINTSSVPEPSIEDYDNRVVSVFGQYRHKINNIEFWTGLRKDHHEEYEDRVSFSSGMAWAVSPEFMIKTILGSAYRTPFAKQTTTERGTDLEQIKNINLQLQYKPGNKSLFAVTLFRNEIDDHVVGDRYEGAGVSLPNSQTIDGIELEWKFSPFESLSLFGNATFLDNSGADETRLFREVTVTSNRMESAEEALTGLRSHAYDTGSDIRVNLGGAWQIRENIRLIPQVEYFSRRSLYYLLEEVPLGEVETREFSDAWLCNLRLQIHDIKSFDIDLYVNNIFNTRFGTFDAKSDHPNESTSVGVTLKYRW